VGNEAPRRASRQAGNQPAKQANMQAAGRRQTQQQKQHMQRGASSPASQPPGQPERQSANQPGARHANQPDSPTASQLPDQTAKRQPQQANHSRASLSLPLRCFFPALRLCVFSFFSWSLVLDDGIRGGDSGEASHFCSEGRLEASDLACNWQACRPTSYKANSLLPESVGRRCGGNAMGVNSRGHNGR
jgi:hypothetical protein